MHTQQSQTSFARPPALLNIKQTAGFIGFSESLIRQWTYRQRPVPAGWPTPVKVTPKALRYKTAEIQSWVDNLGKEKLMAQEVTSAPQPRRPGRPAKVSSRGASK